MSKTTELTIVHANCGRTRRKTPNRVVRVARVGAQFRLHEALTAMQSEELVSNFQCPEQALLLKGVSDAIEGLIDALDRFYGDPEFEPEEDIGADDLGEPELDDLMN